MKVEQQVVTQHVVTLTDDEMRLISQAMVSLGEQNGVVRINGETFSGWKLNDENKALATDIHKALKPYADHSRSVFIAH